MRASFEKLHHELSSTQGQACEPMRAEGDALCFAVSVNGTRATVIYAPQRGRDCAFIVVSLERAPDPLQCELAQLELMEANFAWMVSHTPFVGSCDPATGELCIQFAYPFAQADGANLLARIDAVAAWSGAWARTGDPPLVS